MTAAPILCVDDDPAVLRLVGRILEPAGHDCSVAASVEEARERLAENHYALVLCDINMPDHSGLELLAELAGRSPDVATVMVTGQDDPELADATIESGAFGYVTKPFSANELLIDVANALHRRALELERRGYEHRLEQTVAARTDQLKRAYEETIGRLGRAIQFHDIATGAHVGRVASSSRSLAAALGLVQARADLIELAAPLHDIGKIAVPDAILLKAGPLTPSERAEIEKHTDVGHELLSGSGQEMLDVAASIAWAHHERWDGRGYPRGLAGEAIPLEARIVSVADVFDALTSDRPYRRRFSRTEARETIRAERGRAFDPAVVDAFLEVVEPQ